MSGNTPISQSDRASMACSNTGLPAVGTPCSRQPHRRQPDLASRSGGTLFLPQSLRVALQLCLAEISFVVFLELTHSHSEKIGFDYRLQLASPVA
mmetsp:Transcript_80513/g.202553  ORF Transcript_80513/g.202553 Transcript_80513/m.202553 type:complete len:95 (+) Transcript_80513:608-892(+)